MLTILHLGSAKITNTYLSKTKASSNYPILPILKEKERITVKIIKETLFFSPLMRSKSERNNRRQESENWPRGYKKLMLISAENEFFSCSNMLKCQKLLAFEHILAGKIAF